MASGRVCWWGRKICFKGAGEEGKSVFLMGLVATGSLIMLQWVYEQHRLDLWVLLLLVFCFDFTFLCGRGRSQRCLGTDLGGLESERDQSAWCEIPQQSMKTSCWKKNLTCVSFLLNPFFIATEEVKSKHVCYANENGFALCKVWGTEDIWHNVLRALRNDNCGSHVLRCAIRKHNGGGVTASCFGANEAWYWSKWEFLMVHWVPLFPDGVKTTQLPHSSSWVGNEFVFPVIFHTQLYSKQRCGKHALLYFVWLSVSSSFPSGCLNSGILCVSLVSVVICFSFCISLAETQHYRKDY